MAIEMPRSVIDAPPLAPISAAHHLRLLLGLRAKLAFRGFQRSKSAIFGVILAVLIFLPITLGLGVGAGYLFVTQSPPVAGQVLRGMLIGIYLLWLLAPMLGFQLNDAYDLSRLFVYPVSVRRLFIGSILGSLLDFTTLLLLPTLLAAIVGFATHGVWAALVALLTVPLFLFHTLALSQAVILSTMGILRSRKWRDFAIVAVPLFWVGYQVFARTIMPRYFKHIDWKNALHNPLWEAASFLPPGAAARAMTGAAQGHVLESLLFLALLGAYTVGTVYLASWLVGRAYDGDDVSLFKGKKESPRPLPRSGRVEVSAPMAGAYGLPPVVVAMVDKEIKYFTRDPYFRVALVNSLYILVIVLFNSTRSNGQALPGGLGLWLSTSLLLFQQTVMVYNQFGTDGAAAPVLFGFPSSRRQMILGKNLPLFGALAVFNLVLGTALCFLTHSAEMIPMILLWLVMALGVMFAVGNLMSVYFPFKVVVKGFRMRQQRASQGIAYTFLNLGVSLAALVLFAPALAAVLVPWYFISKLWLFLTVPLALVYVVGLYLFSLHFAEIALLKREPEVLERVYRAPE